MSMFNGPVYDFVMEEETNSPALKGWAYCCKHVFTCSYLCDKFKANLLHFVDLHLHEHERVYFSVPPVPASVVDTPEKFTAFWGAVKNWCTEVLHSQYYELVYEGEGIRNGGVGLATKLNCTADVMIPKITGLLQPCTREQSVALRTVYHFGSLYESKEDIKAGVVQILYGPASLLNNDNASCFTFVDRDYLTDVTVKWNVKKQVLIGKKGIEVTDVESVRGVCLYCKDSSFFFADGEQILVFYQDSHFVDLTSESSDAGSALSPAVAARRKRMRFNYTLEPDATYAVSRCNSSSIGSSSSYSPSSTGSDSTYV